jgi:hypothetical protein
MSAQIHEKHITPPTPIESGFRRKCHQETNDGAAEIGGDPHSKRVCIFTKSDWLCFFFLRDGPILLLNRGVDRDGWKLYARRGNPKVHITRSTRTTFLAWSRHN